jgi:hypothetical protein
MLELETVFFIGQKNRKEISIVGSRREIQLRGTGSAIFVPGSAEIAWNGASFTVVSCFEGRAPGDAVSWLVGVICHCTQQSLRSRQQWIKLSLKMQADTISIEFARQQ